MKTNKDKQTRKLKSDIEHIIGFGLVLGILLSLLIFLIIGDNEVNSLEQELQSCREKVPVWTLNYICDWQEQGQFITSTWTFDDYGVYELAKEVLIERECEIISE